MPGVQKGFGEPGGMRCCSPGEEHPWSPAVAPLAVHGFTTAVHSPLRIHLLPFCHPFSRRKRLRECQSLSGSPSRVQRQQLGQDHPSQVPATALPQHAARHQQPQAGFTCDHLAEREGANAPFGECLTEFCEETGVGAHPLPADRLQGGLCARADAVRAPIPCHSRGSWQGDLRRKAWIPVCTVPDANIMVQSSVPCKQAQCKSPASGTSLTRMHHTCPVVGEGTVPASMAARRLAGLSS